MFVCLQIVSVRRGNREGGEGGETEREERGRNELGLVAQVP